ncbi:MAG TPA: hypothetical protein VF609_06960 [Flavisolibacter sp.]|jgi:hypothetical protein
MDFESIIPFLLILAPFAIAFFMEALVLYFFKVKGFGLSILTSVLINLVALAVVYFLGAPLLGKLGYEIGQFNGLNLQPQVVAFICWLSIIIDGLLLQLLFRRQERKRLYSASIVMNILSYLFFHFFIVYSH